MKKTMKKSLSTAAGITFVAAMSASPVANADANPFGMQNLEGGYMHVAEAEGKCGEGKCGEGKKAKKEGKCGEGKCLSLIHISEPTRQYCPSRVTSEA